MRALSIAPRCVRTPLCGQYTPSTSLPLRSTSSRSLVSSALCTSRSSSTLFPSTAILRTRTLGLNFERFFSSTSYSKTKEEDDAFRALQSRKWYEMGAGAWVGLALLAGVGIALVIFFWQHRQERARLHAVKVAGKSRIGGNWSLVDQHGQPISSASLHGKYVLLYFGFTFCPDVCPVELKKMAAVVDALEAGGASVQPLFVSLDPWRDSVEQIGAYTAQFHPRLLGATGTPQQCEHVAKLFRVYTSSDRSGAVDASGDDYTVDHSIFLYLLDPKGKFVDFYGVNKDANEVAQGIRAHMVERGDLQESFFARIQRFFRSDD